jgi:hypothetical protein
LSSRAGMELANAVVWIREMALCFRDRSRSA